MLEHVLDLLKKSGSLNRMDTRRMFFKIKGSQEKRERGDEIDYSLAKVYIVTSVRGVPSYYGYTTQELRDRLLDHQLNFSVGKRDGCEEHIRNGASIDLVEEYPCSTRDEILKRVRYYRKNFT